MELVGSMYCSSYFVIVIIMITLVILLVGDGSELQCAWQGQVR